jgi:hypothetical protein
VPGFGSPASVAGTSKGDAWWNSVDMAGSAHGGVGSSPDNDIVPGEGEVPGFGKRQRRRVRRRRRRRLTANAGGRPNGPSISSAAAVNGQGHMADSKLMIGPIFGMGLVGIVEVRAVSVACSRMA